MVDNTDNSETQVQDAPDEDKFVVPDLDSVSDSEDKPKFPQTEKVEIVGDDKADKADKADKEGESGDKGGKDPDSAEAHRAYQVRQSRREAREAKAALEAIREEIASLKGSISKDSKSVDGPPKPPSPKDFEFGIDDDKYIDARNEYEINRDTYVLKQAEERAAKMYDNLADNLQNQQAVSQLEHRVAEIQKKGLDKYKDFDDVVEDAFAAMQPDTGALQSLALQDGAEDVVYHLAKNPDVLGRITGMDPMAQAFEMGRMASQFAAGRDAAKTSVTKAKATPTQPRGATGQFSSSEDALYDRLLKRADI